MPPLNKAQAAKLAAVAQNGIARAVRPANATFDGDSLFAMCHGTVPADPDAVGILAARAVEEAIRRGNPRGRNLHGRPAWRDLPLYPNLPEPRKGEVMQKVSQLPYQRVSMEAFAQEIQGIITQVKEASSAQAVMAARDQCNQLVVRWQTAEALSYMRYSINTADPFTWRRRTTMMRWVPRHRTTFWSTPRPCWRPRSAGNWRRVGDHPLVFRSFEVELKSISPEIIEDMVEENRVVSQYSQLMAGDGVRVPRGRSCPAPC